MTDIATTPITNLIGDLDTYADELDGEGWHNAANGCRAAIAEVERLRAALRALLVHDYAEECQECGIGRSAAWKNARAALEGK